MSSILLTTLLSLTAALPVGNTPEPVAMPHFPDTLHAFVFRNWPLVLVERMAKTVQATPEQIIALGASMGLPPQETISKDQWQRSYITIIRRNWHLLPYDQMLTLLDWTEDQLAFTLREDDFLYIKLGSLKPKCPPLRYAPPDAAAQTRAKEIAALYQDLPAPKTIDPLFSFVEKLSAPLEGEVTPPPESQFSPRFWSSYFATYGDPLLEDEPDPYPDGYLARMAASGVDGVWMQAVLYKLAPYPWAPEKSERYEERLEQLRKLTERAKKHGIGVYLYLNEPRAMPLDFFEGREGIKGVVEGDHAAVCVSVPEVKQYLEDSVAFICKHAPELAGFFTISGSENLTNCWSHRKGMDCPRCGERGPESVISDVNIAIRNGIAQAGTDARLIAWDWGWLDDWAPGIIAKLPKDVALMSVSEWSIPIARGGVETAVGEYSISVVGPGPRARKHWALAKDAGLDRIAKIQANNTWEISSVPYIPAVANVAQHAANLRGAEVSGMMLGWTLGGHPSPNLEVVAALGTKEEISVDEALNRVASNRFGADAAEEVVQAWQVMSKGFSEFPYHGGTNYTAPLQLGPANPLYAEATGYKATMVGIPYDHLRAWRSVYPAKIFIQQIDKVTKGFQDGLEILNRVKPGETQAEKDNLDQERRISEVCAIHFASVANQCRFVMARDALATAKDAATATPLLAELNKLLVSEIALATRMRELQLEDARFGFEASNHYFYIPQDLAEKVVNCRYLLDVWLPKVGK